MLESFADNRAAERMVREQITCRGITDERVIAVMSHVPRHLFVPGRPLRDAYSDFPLSIGYRQTISQPYMVAYMTQELELSGGERVLEIGTGSGYQTAVLAELSREVYTVERIAPLLSRAKQTLDRLGITGVHYRLGDGFEGWPQMAPFDRILVAAAAATVPSPLQAQLADNGILLIPLGDTALYQSLVKVRRTGNRFDSREGIGCRFVPLVH